MNPLDQLADIQTPGAVAWWPLAWGYWVLIALLVLVVLGAVYAFIKQRTASRVKREALVSLQNIPASDIYFAHKVQVILKQTCGYYFTQTASSQLAGIAWQKFLLAHYQGASPEDVQAMAQCIQHRLYAPLDENSPNVQENEKLRLWAQHYISTSAKWVKSSSKLNGTSSEVAHV